MRRSRVCVSVVIGFLAVALVGAAACAPPPPDAPDIRILGGPGNIEGKFALPRAAAWDPAGKVLYVVDKSGRIQVFSDSHEYLRGWSTPEVEKGRPTGLAVDSDGTLHVADTHYHRILRYSPDGKLLGQFGSFGTGDGQFIYPVGLAFGPEGTLYVSEYGGNDRIQVFDRERRRIGGWGRYGEAAGEFKRPQGLAFTGGKLYVADVANNRIQVFSAAGAFEREWGGLRYPYSVSVDARGDLLVAEYGAHRVSRFSPDGKLRGRSGAPGTAPGELDTPWGAVACADGLFIVDSGNHRVQRWPASRLEGP